MGVNEFKNARELFVSSFASFAPLSSSASSSSSSMLRRGPIDAMDELEADWLTARTGLAELLTNIGTPHCI